MWVRQVTVSSMSEPLLTVEDMAQMLKSTRRGIYNRVHRGQIPHLKIGQRVYFRPDVIDAWLNLHVVDSGSGDAA